MHPSDDITEQTAILSFHMPFFSVETNLAPQTVNVQIKNESYVDDVPEEDFTFKILLAIIIILLIVVIFIGPKKFRKSKKK